MCGIRFNTLNNIGLGRYVHKDSKKEYSSNPVVQKNNSFGLYDSQLANINKSRISSLFWLLSSPKTRSLYLGTPSALANVKILLKAIELCPVSQ